jgi:cytochrome c oxidase subunit 3
VTAVLLFLAVIAAVSGWWLSQQRLTAKPWLEEGALGEFPGSDGLSLPVAKVGLGVFLVVASSLFALLISAYFVRIDIAALNVVDGMRLPAPGLLWFNTGVLVLSSGALQWAWIDARRGQREGVRIDLLAGGALALVFVAGQLLAWRQLVQAGYFAASNPANAFFYLLTGVHGLHVVGGLVALGRTIARDRRSAVVGQVRQSVELCAIYWHFLLLVWLVVFSLVMGWLDGFAAICRAVIS